MKPRVVCRPKKPAARRTRPPAKAAPKLLRHESREPSIAYLGRFIPGFYP